MKKLIFAVAVFTSALTLAACFGPTREEIAAADDSTCGSMGLKFGSSEFAQCRMLLLQQREANAAQARPRLPVVGSYKLTFFWSS
jgi:hypothetical protein